jgi:DNA invertase Pin-like site-specific DNA recombinase
VTQIQTPTSTDDLIRAAQYVRMSTEQQQFSIDNQSAAISLYAREHRMEIVTSYADAGKSGLTVENRPGLRRMIADVESGSPGYSAILVYDVSRWGRFQDADESAYYEYRCRRANIAVHYCVESFSNDGSTFATLLKAIKRTMAAEYSRDLSARVFAGQARLTELGFRQGGTAGYGFRRLLVDEHGKSKFVLQPGERKSIATDRIILIPGPSEEIAAVNEVFRLYAVERWSPTKIAKTLNGRGIRCVGGRPWTRHLVREIVTNPKYVGANVSNRHSGKLRTRQIRNPPEMWIRCDNAFQAIVDPELFRKAEAIASRPFSFTDEQLLEHLRQFLRQNGKLSQRLISESLDMPSSEVYNSRFGGLSEAYRRIGYKTARNLSYIERDRMLMPIRRAFIAKVMGEIVSVGASVRQDPRTKLLIVNENFKMRLTIAPCRALKRSHSWKLYLYSPLNPDVILIARLALDNKAILDYFCLPCSPRYPGQMTVKQVNSSAIDVHRFPELNFLQDVIMRGRC